MTFPMVFLLVVAFASLLGFPTLGFKAALMHVDNGKSLKPNELFLRAMKRTNNRVEALEQPKIINHSKSLGRIHDKAEMGEYFMKLTIGSPPTSYLALIDIDNDLIWTSCDPTLCNPQQQQNDCSQYDSSKSTTYTKVSCASNACRLATNSSCSSATRDSCMYKYEYMGDPNPSWTQGELAIEKFGSFNGEGSLGRLMFGCAHTTSEDMRSVESGLIGLGKGFLSLVSQTKSTVFSHCFPSYDNPDSTGALALGAHVRIPPNARGVVTTDMVQNTHKPSSYYVSLKGIKVNGTALTLNPTAFQIDGEGQGGIAVDSGMTVSYLEESIYGKLKEKLISLITLERASGDKVGLDLCFVLPEGLDGAAYDKLFPSIAFTFANGVKRADLAFPTGNVFRAFNDVEQGEIACLAMVAAPATDGRSSLGNLQLQQTLVVYNLAAKKVAFLPNSQCENM